MRRFLNPLQARSPKTAAAAFAVLAGVIMMALAGVALAKTLVLQVGHNAKVTNQSGMANRENIAVSHGFAVYTLTGDSKRHPECTKANGCFNFWTPVTVASHGKLSKARGIRGKLSVWHRNGFNQLLLNGHPLYRFVLDHQRDQAAGEGINSFGGTWHVVKASNSSTGSTGTTTTPPSPMCAYPPC